MLPSIILGVFGVVLTLTIAFGIIGKGVDDSNKKNI
jgi:hypothetical protein